MNKRSSGIVPNMRRSRQPAVENPELVFGLVGPIGVDIEAVIEGLKVALTEMKYNTEVVHLTQMMSHKSVRTRVDETSYFKRYMSLIRYANEYRKAAGSPAAMAGLAMARIRQKRPRRGLVMEPALGTAYIVRQFKRPEEIDAMRRVYGRKFVQVSVYGSPLDRRRVIMDKIASFDSSPKKDSEREAQAIELIATDANQADEENGQRVSDVFHLGDVFVNGIDKDMAAITLRRFVRAFFGDNFASPSIDEFGLYTATSASLRSVDLSRQVGAAIFTPLGDIISMGCNEVPKAGGGNYWADSGELLARDMERGKDANQLRKDEILFDLVDRLSKSKSLSGALNRKKGTQERVEAIMAKSSMKEAQLLDIIEFGRMIHAEMSALTDAARLGRSTSGTTLYCTTFPCHLCAKHIVAAGVRRVVFLEPYPKSNAQKLHDDSITLEKDESAKVFFEPFMGISPRRYRDIFEKKKRKDGRGRAQEWYEGSPVPRIEDRSAAYIENEESEIFLALPKFVARGSRRQGRPKKGVDKP